MDFFMKNRGKLDAPEITGVTFSPHVTENCYKSQDSVVSFGQSIAKKQPSKTARREMTSLVSSSALLVLACLGTTHANGYRGWNVNSLDQDSLDFGVDCKSSACRTMFPEKRGGQLEQVENKPWPVSRVVTSYHIASKPWQQLSCSCETQYDIIDLGLENYPRYLATARCTPKPCHNKFNQCKLIPYKVHILRQRDDNVGNEASDEQTYVEQTLLPESLRSKWQMKPIKIAVACVAGQSNKN